MNIKFIPLSSFSIAARRLVFPLKQNGIAKKKVFFTVHMDGLIYSSALHRV